MTVENPTPPVSTEEVIEGESPEVTEAKKLANEQLRKHTEAVEKENAALRQQVLNTQLKEIGLSTDTGLGKAIAKEYKGDLDLESIAAYAQSEYGHEATPEQTPAAVATGQRMEQVQAQSAPVTPTPTTTPAQEAAARLHDPSASREDAQLSLTGKVLDFTQRVYGPEGPQAPSDQQGS